MTAKQFLVDDRPKAKFFREKIGDREYELREDKLDVLDEIVLWDGNPRLLPYLAEAGTFQSEQDLEHHLRRSKGYDQLLRSILDIGQMEPIYAWKREDQGKYVVIEGATRVTVLRELARKNTGKAIEARFRHVTAKVLPPDFGEEERVILLARIHVRGTGVRSWGRYIEARFVYETVAGTDGQKPLMSIRDLARHMSKSDSWVSRLKDAYKFAQEFVEATDSPDSERLAAEHFSTLEEIAKCRDIGPKLKDYTNPDYDELRADVFEMVRKGVFKEYRDARFMKEFHDDSEKWAILKQGDKGIANKLANELKAGSTSLKAKLQVLPGQLERALEREPDAINEDDLESLHRAIMIAHSYLHRGVPRFKLELVTFIEALESASLADIKAVHRDEMERLDDALTDFRIRLDKHRSWH
jgi:hypothetical protein